MAKKVLQRQERQVKVVSVAAIFRLTAETEKGNLTTDKGIPRISGKPKKGYP